MENNKSQKRLVRRIIKKLQSIKNLNTLSSNQYQKIVEQLKTFTADAIDALYMLTTEKQDSAENKINSVKNSKWETEFLSTAESSFKILLDSERKRFLDQVSLISAYKHRLKDRTNLDANQNHSETSEASTKIDLSPFSRLHRTMPNMESLNNVSDEIYQSLIRVEMNSQTKLSRVLLQMCIK